MKSRMFTGIGPPEFELVYDSEKPDQGQMTITSFFNQWVSGNGRKLQIPVRVSHTKGGTK